jgi:hypothetical protein
MSKQKRTNVCQWCGVGFPNATEHMIHVTTDHADTIGRGRTMSKAWACLDLTCGHDNPPVVHECIVCGTPNPAVAATNARRRFVIARKRPDGTLSRSREMDYDTARASMPVLPAIMRTIEPDPINDYTLDPRRFEVWHDGQRVAWLEVSKVTATPNYQDMRSYP